MYRTVFKKEKLNFSLFMLVLQITMLVCSVCVSMPVCTCVQRALDRKGEWNGGVQGPTGTYP